jgi:hypothetical protein
MVVMDVDASSTPVSPGEDDSKLPVDPDAEPAAQISAQRLQPIARWRGEIPEVDRRLEEVQLSLRNAPESLGKNGTGGSAVHSVINV